MNFTIENPYHFEYLKVQCGDIADYAYDFKTWCEKYEERIERVYESMKSVLPEKCGSLLDVGGGLSGIGARLNAHYGGNVHVAVLDGKNTLAVVDKHAQPFNNATVTQNFLRRNGVRSQSFFGPEDEIAETFDLIISTQAWCFHIPPERYLAKIEKALKPGGTLIVDIRRSHRSWQEQMYKVFGSETYLACKPKWYRVAYECVYAE